MIASWIKPQLTTLALPHYELGRTAIEVLLAEADAPPNEQSQVHRIPMPLRERGSVRRLDSSGSARRASAEPAAAQS
jgi:LacI family transcriptional regulator